jgi:hypothetical protein
MMNKCSRFILFDAKSQATDLPGRLGRTALEDGPSLERKKPPGRQCAADKLIVAFVGDE